MFLDRHPIAHRQRINRLLIFKAQLTTEIMIKFNNGLYTAIIEDGNLILDSLTDVFIFEGAGKRLIEEAENAFYSLKYAGQRLNGFISDYINDNAQYFVDTHKDEAQKVEDFSKNLN